MSNIEWVALLALSALVLVSLLLGYLMYRVRAKYIHVDVRSGKSPGSTHDQGYEYYRYDVEEYGCVSLLATVLGVLCFAVGVTSFVMLLYVIVVFVIIPSFDKMISALAVAYGIVEVFSLILLAVLFVLSFFKDLFNPPR